MPGGGGTGCRQHGERHEGRPGSGGRWWCGGQTPGPALAQHLGSGLAKPGRFQPEQYAGDVHRLPEQAARQAGQNLRH